MDGTFDAYMAAQYVGVLDGVLVPTVEMVRYTGGEDGVGWLLAVAAAADSGACVSADDDGFCYTALPFVRKSAAVAADLKAWPELGRVLAEPLREDVVTECSVDISENGHGLHISAEGGGVHSITAVETAAKVIGRVAPGYVSKEVMALPVGGGAPVRSADTGTVVQSQALRLLSAVTSAVTVCGLSDEICGCLEQATKAHLGADSCLDEVVAMLVGSARTPGTSTVSVAHRGRSVLVHRRVDTLLYARVGVWQDELGAWHAHMLMEKPLCRHGGMRIMRAEEFLEWLENDTSILGCRTGVPIAVPRAGQDLVTCVQGIDVSDTGVGSTSSGNAGVFTGDVRRIIHFAVGDDANEYVSRYESVAAKAAWMRKFHPRYGEESVGDPALAREFNLHYLTNRRIYLLWLVEDLRGHIEQAKAEGQFRRETLSDFFVAEASSSSGGTNDTQQVQAGTLVWTGMIYAPSIRKHKVRWSVTRRGAGAICGLTGDTCTHLRSLEDLRTHMREVHMGVQT